MTVKDAITFLDKSVSDSKAGLPEDVFYFISRMTPFVNIDLLIKDELGRTLLSWRDDEYCGIGWHLPGGIVRFKETLETRIKKVAESEIGAEVKFEPAPVAVNEIIDKEKDIMGHFISILYKCSLLSSFVLKNKGLTEKDKGFLKWHKTCPDNLLKSQEFYRKYL